MLRESFVSGGCGEEILAVSDVHNCFGSPEEVCRGSCSPQVDRNSLTVETTLAFSKNSPGTILWHLDIAVTEITVQ